MLVCERTKSTNLGKRRGLDVLETTALQIFKHAMNKRISEISYVQVPDGD